MITIIAAIGKNNELGKDNDLIWHLPADLKRFKKVTTGHTIIMGRNTFESIGKPLPNRRSVIITRNKDYKQEGCEVVHSLEDAINLVEDEQAFIIGGAQIYKESLEKGLADQLDITKVHQDFEADVFFPEIDQKIWQEFSKEDFEADDKNKFNFSFLQYRKN
jgi:dihydrofolate reductase